MSFRTDVLLAVLLLASTVRTSTQTIATWRDPSPHQLRLVTVDENVQLEVLDWGGSGRTIVLLAGGGNTAHVFDDFAPKLASDGHVYGITRRGHGASSAGLSGYAVERLGQDVAKVLDALSASSVVLVGHSIAGQELSFFASRFPQRVDGLVYLDAAYFYAFQGPNPPKPKVPTPTPTRPSTPLPQPPPPGPDDLKDIAAYRAYSQHYRGYAPPESEIWQTRMIGSDGSVGPVRTPASVLEAILAGGQRFSELKVPALAIFPSPHDIGPWARDNPAQRATIPAFERLDEESIERQAKAFEAGVPGSRAVRLRNANHYVFLSHEEAVLREIRTFIKALR
jgi:pimeloyl-ACP methyl ester carboxylesterase